MNSTTETDVDQNSYLLKLEARIVSMENTIQAQVDLLTKIQNAIVPAMEKLENSPIGKMLGV